jgi:hypothetical protein
MTDYIKKLTKIRNQRQDLALIEQLVFTGEFMIMFRDIQQEAMKNKQQSDNVNRLIDQFSKAMNSKSIPTAITALQYVLVNILATTAEDMNKMIKEQNKTNSGNNMEVQ